MSRRDGGSRRVEEYEERAYFERDGPPPRPRAAAPVRARDLLEVDIRERRSSNARDRQPDFLRDDLTRNDQPLVLRKREVETITRPVRRSPSPVERERVRTRVVERERERTPSPVERERVRTRVVERERERSPSPVERERVRTRVVERERERSPSPVERERVRTRVVERERERSPSPIERERVRTRVVERQRERSPSPVERERVRTRVVERERDRSPEPEIYRTRVVERERDRSFSPYGERSHTRYIERDSERTRPQEPSMEKSRTTTRIVERERERERTPSPIRERETETIRTRTIERERERARSVSSESSVSEIIDREPPIVRAPPIHQEIITHHRHIDHGYVYEPTPVPTPPPPARAPRRESPREATREKDTEIDIYKGRGETDIDIHMSKRGGREEVREKRPPRDREFYDDDVLIERDRNHLHIRESRNSRRRSVSSRRERMDDDGSEADFYARRTTERAFMGETARDWAIEDVPSGTERVKVDIGPGGEEITWQKTNHVRRSKFAPERDSMAVYDREREYEREEIVSDRRIALPPPPRNKYGDMWTEITKDLVVREAIEQLGYDYEETEFFFYVIQYLSYDDVQELVFLSDDIKKARRRRIKDLARERERLKEKEVLRIEDRPQYEDERIIEREFVYDSGPRRSRRY